MKRFLSIIVLASMTLHCLSRLGVVSYVYENRYEIAYALGIAAEKMISMCNEDYFQDSSLTAHHDNEKQTPANWTQAREIVLCCPSDATVLFGPLETDFEYIHHYLSREYVNHLSDIFHPPSLSS